VIIDVRCYIISKQFLFGNGRWGLLRQQGNYIFRGLDKVRLLQLLSFNSVNVLIIQMHFISRVANAMLILAHKLNQFLPSPTAVLSAMPMVVYEF